MFEDLLTVTIIFARREYFVPEAQMGPLLWALTEAPETIRPFEPWLLKRTAKAKRMSPEGTIRLPKETHTKR